jgi:hypothetical protein
MEQIKNNMNKLQKQNLNEAIAKTLSQVRNDWTKMGGVTKTLKKAAHKARMKAFEQNAFNKDKK